MHALRQHARVPEEILGADEHELGEHNGVSAGRRRDIWLCDVVPIGRSRSGVEAKMREFIFIAQHKIRFGCGVAILTGVWCLKKCSFGCTSFYPVTVDCRGTSSSWGHALLNKT